MRGSALGLVALCLAAAPAPPARAQDEERASELEALRAAIDEHRERVTAFEREERGLLETLERIDQALAALEQDRDRAARDAADARGRLDGVEGEMVVLEGRAAATRDALRHRVVALYKAGDLGPVQALFSAGDLREALARAEVLQRLLDHDERLLRRWRQEREALESVRLEAAMARDDHDVAVARLSERAGEIERERGARGRVLAAVRDDRRRTRAALNELEAAARALEETLAHLRESAPPVAPREGGVPFASRRGSLDAPVEASVAQTFGRVVDREFRTETFRKGVEFESAIGDPVYAVADGVVRFAGWFRGYGRIVILDHGDDYFTVSGHLDEVHVAPGDPVREGDRIAEAGDTGSLAGPRLYFEIRRGAEALDPARWLRGGAGR